MQTLHNSTASFLSFFLCAFTLSVQIMKKEAHPSVHTPNPNKCRLNNRSVLAEHSCGRTVNGKHVRFSLMNERETAQEMSSDSQEQFDTAESCERDVKKEIVLNLQPLKQWARKAASKWWIIMIFSRSKLSVMNPSLCDLMTCVVVLCVDTNAFQVAHCKFDISKRLFSQ